MLLQEIERKFTFYFCLPTDVFLVEDALSAYRWVRDQEGRHEPTNLLEISDSSVSL